MKVYFKLLFLFQFTFLSSLLAQNNESILWEISGNGLSENSYLFGSIHLTDKRVFNFPDSVIAKLKACEVTAFELNLDSISGELIKENLKDNEGKQLKQLMSTTELEKFKKDLKKYNINAENIETKTATEVFQKLNTSKAKKSQNNVTFLDAYLFQTAKLCGNNIIGLESYQDQSKLFEKLDIQLQKKTIMDMLDSSNVKQYFGQKDDMINLYIKEDIVGLYNFISNNSSFEYENELLGKRNHKMDVKIDSLIKLNSTFVCVGAGHLAGEEGLIKLLQLRGYNVMPLKSPKSEYYKKIMPADRELAWPTFTDSLSGYMVNMPGLPEEMGVASTSMRGFADLGTGYFYMSGISSNSAGIKQNPEKIGKQMLARLGNKGDIKSTKKIVYNGLEGAEVALKIEPSIYYYVRLLNDENSSYLLMIGSQSKFPNKTSVKRFFNSFKKVPKQSIKDMMFENKQCGFKMQVPSNFKLTNSLVQDDIRQLKFECSDFENGGDIIVFSTDYGASKYFFDPVSVFDNAYEAVKDAIGQEPNTVEDGKIEGYIYRDYTTFLSDKSCMIARYILRGSRLYGIVFAYNDSTSLLKAAKRLETFAFTPLINVALKKYTSPQNDFEILAPDSLTSLIDTSYTGNISYNYTSFDTATTNWLHIDKQTFAPYTYFKNDSSVFNFVRGKFVFESDSIIDSTIAIINGNKTFNYTIAYSKNSTIKKHIRVYLHGSSYYFLATLTDELAPHQKFYETTFSSFNILNKKDSFDVFKYKLPVLVANLSETDSVKFREAYNVYKNYTVENNELELIKSTLNKSYPLISENDLPIAFYSYQHILNNLDSVKIIEYLKSEFEQMPNESSVKLMALSYLANNTHPDAIRLWAKLISQAPIKGDDQGYIFNAMGKLYYDSIPQLKEILPLLEPLINDSTYNVVYLALASNALKYKFVQSNDLAKNYEAIKVITIKEYEILNTPKNGEKIYYSNQFDYGLDILNSFASNQDIVNLNQKILTDTIIEYKINSFKYLIKNNIKIAEKPIESYLERPENRKYFYEALIELNATQLYPKKLLKQKHFAEGNIYNVALYDDYRPSKVEFIDEKKVLLNQKQQMFYLYKVYFDDEFYLGIAGPFDPSNKKNVQTSAQHTSIIYDDFYSKSLDQHMVAFLNGIE